MGIWCAEGAHVAVDAFPRACVIKRLISADLANQHGGGYSFACHESPLCVRSASKSSVLVFRLGFFVRLFSWP